MIPRNDNERMSAWLERAWLQNYLERGLDDEESAWFEAYVLDKPELLQAIETDTDLRDGLAVVAAEQSSFATAGVDSRPRSSSMPRWLALAAMLVVGIGVGLFVPRTATDPGMPLTANPARVVYDTMRGTAAEPQFERAALQAADVLLVEVAVPPAASEIELRIAGDAPRQLRMSADAFVSFLIERKRAESVRTASVEYALGDEKQRLEISFPTK